MLTNLLATTFACNPNYRTWADKKETACDEYKGWGYCTSDGGYGDKWESERGGTFEDLAMFGYDGRNCPQCGCTAEGKFVYANEAHNRFI